MPTIDRHLFVIFGATGDLTRRKLIPALYHVMQQDEVASNCYILGVARSGWSDDRFRSEAREALQQHFETDALDQWCDNHLFYQSIGPDSDRYGDLKDRIHALETAHDLPGNRVFYLSLPPPTYGPTTEALGEEGLNESDGWTRLVIEKPFGHDLDSAHELNALVHQHFDETQVYRIDHYLGKETVQNLLAFRFGNALFEAVWNRDRIEQVEITVAESLGVEGRAGYYDDAGHLRDMVQNHLTQLFTLVAMEPPATFDADAIRDEKVKVLRATRPLDPARALLGQYTAGTHAGDEVLGYREEEGVPEDSATETFAQLPVYIDNWRWQGVPFILRSGKRLPQKLTQIAVRFECAPVSLFENAGAEAPSCNVSQNELIITLQPNEGFDLRFEVKKPGESIRLETQKLSFRYEEAFGPVPDAYETLIRDIIQGDQTLFVRSDEVEASWALYAPLLAAERSPAPYPAGAWGPKAVAAPSPA